MKTFCKAIHRLSFSSGRVLTHLWIWSLLSSMAIYEPAFAISPLDREVSLNIPMEEALIAFSRQKDVQLVLRQGGGGTAESNPVASAMSARDALKNLIRGTGCDYACDYATVGNSISVTCSESSLERAPRALEDQSNTSNLPDSSASTALPSSPQHGVKGQSGELAGVIVNSKRREEKVNEVPISISVVRGEDLDRSTLSGVTDALNTVPGVSAFANQFQASGTQLSLRENGYVLSLISSISSKARSTREK